MISHGESFGEQDGNSVTVRVDGVSGTIIMNRVPARNAISRSMLAQLHQALDDLHQEKRVRGVIVTGAGEAFSSGSDLSEIKSSMNDDDVQSKWFEDCTYQKELIEKILRFPKPVIAAVNGPALGLGAAIVLAADIVIGTESATLGFPETQRGLVPGIAAPLLAFRLGCSAAADFLLRPDFATAAECIDMGIYRAMVGADLVWAKADAISRDLAQTDPTAISMTKRLLNESVGEQLFMQLAAGAAATAAARTTEAAEEGINAFLEKREPNWP